MTTLYHGTNVHFDQPDLSKCDRRTDFGPGFYLTPDQENAEKFAKAAVEENGGVATVICFDYDEKKADSLKPRCLDRADATWLHFIMANRNEWKHVADHNLDLRYPIVKGLVADANFVKLMKKYRKDQVKCEAAVLKEFQCQKYKKYQYSFHTQEALCCLKKKRSYTCQ